MQNIDYATEKDGVETASVAGEDVFEDTLPSPIKKADKRRKKHTGSESDTDFQADTEEESEPEPPIADIEAARELEAARRRSTTTIANSTLYEQNGAGASKFSSTSTFRFPSVTLPLQSSAQHEPQQPLRGGVKIRLPPVGVSKESTHQAPPKPTTSSIPSARAALQTPKTNSSAVKPFQRANFPIRSPLEPTYGIFSNRICPACNKNHPQGACELKAAGVEHCGLCGLAHYGYSRTCPHIKSETQVREMLEALKNSPEKKELVDAALKYLRGVKGTLVQQKKKDREKAELLKNGGQLPAPTLARPPKNTPSTQMQRHVSQNVPLQPPSSYSATLPGRDDPNAYVRYTPPVNPATGSVGSHLQQQQRAMQMQAQGGYEDQEVESALRGFLGQ